MHYRLNYQLGTLLILSLAAIAIALIVWFQQQSFKQYEASNELWRHYVLNEKLITETIQTLKSHFGYGGLIHHYKNYVLRGDPNDLKAIQLDMQKIRHQLTQLDQLLYSPSALSVLSDLAQFLDEYEAKTRLITQLHQVKTPLHQIDQQSKISDQKTLNALKILNHSIEERTQQALQHSEHKMQQATEFLKLGWIFILPIIALTLFLLWLLKTTFAERVQTLRLQKQAEKLLDTTPDAMLFVDLNGQVQKANKMAETFFGYSKEEMQGMAVESFMPENFREHHVHLRDNYARSPYNRYMRPNHLLFALKKNGETCPVEIRLGYWENDAEPLVIAAIRDVSEQETIRQNLKRSQLKTKLALHNLEQAMENLVESEKMAALGSLVAGVSHEINTPIGVCLMAVSYLNDEVKALQTAFQQNDLAEDYFIQFLNSAVDSTQLIENNLNRAASLINDFKKVAVDQSSEEKRSFSLCESVDEIVHSLQPIFKNHPVKLTAECTLPQILNTYPGALSQCLTNLITNAEKHAFSAEQAGEIRVIITALEEEEIQIQVIDNGVGIPYELQKKVFDPFFTTKRGEGGSGLGMHIVYNLITQKLKGSVQLKSEPNKGTTVTLRFPSNLES